MEQPPQAPPYAPAPPPSPPPSKSRKTLWIVLGVVGVLFLCCCGFATFTVLVGGGKQAGTGTPSTTGGGQAPPAEERNQGVVGRPIQVGEVRWIVGRPRKQVEISSGNEFIPATKASGVFVVVPLTAELTGKESGTIDESQLKIVDRKGRKFEPTAEGTVAVLLGDDWIFLKQVNPNVPVKGVAVFDVAKDARSLELEIHDLRVFSDDVGYVRLGL